MKAQHIRLHSIYADLNHRELKPLVVQALRHGKTATGVAACQTG